MWGMRIHQRLWYDRRFRVATGLARVGSGRKAPKADPATFAQPLGGPWQTYISSSDSVGVACGHWDRRLSSLLLSFAATHQCARKPRRNGLRWVSGSTVGLAPLFRSGYGSVSMP